MTECWNERTQLLLGEDGLARLAQARVLVAGLGGVGGACAESLVRAGIGTVWLLDHDVFGASNLNRQLLATEAVLGRAKAAVAAERLASLGTGAALIPLPIFLAESAVAGLLDELAPDAVADCIDTVGVKAELLMQARARGIATMTALGAGNRLDAGAVRLGRLDQVQGCGLGRALRTRIKRAGVPRDFPVVYSTELPVKKPAPHVPNESGIRPRAINGTISYLPNIFGHMVAGELIRRLLRETP
ncbi:ThiF family adenylyltransferase [Halothiobacillus sp. DCM-1]|uniref:tRNA threonylcarbamoyladenosine dehydratase n=1 Tax=Halothiobacillus sp. DCM-1 TaxID=3112558 RepID=UPI003250B113